jgi:cobalt/nickel transport system permease protein
MISFAFSARLWAVHLPDGVLSWPWAAGGFIVAAILAMIGAWRIRDEEIPQVALLTAAFFVASLIHVPVPVGPRAHLLLNGLLGVILGRRSALAIPVALFLQAALFGHGGFTALGVNSCVMTLPALLAWLLFAGLRRVPWVRRPAFRAGLVAVSTLVFVLSLVYSVVLLATHGFSQNDTLDLAAANRFLMHPATLIVAGILALLAAWFERRLQNTAEFPLGLLVGETAVLATVLLNCLALLWGGQGNYHTLALLTLVIHLPLAVLEGIVLGFTVGFLVRVKPALLGWNVPPQPEPAVDSLMRPPEPSSDGRILEKTECTSDRLP